MPPWYVASDKNKESGSANPLGDGIRVRSGDGDSLELDAGRVLGGV